MLNGKVVYKRQNSCIEICVDKMSDCEAICYIVNKGRYIIFMTSSIVITTKQHLKIII